MILDISNLMNYSFNFENISYKKIINTDPDPLSLNAFLFINLIHL